MVEALLTLPVLLLLFLGLTQLILITWARLLVTRAVDRVVRSAVTVASDAPRFHDGAPRGDFQPGGPRHQSLSRAAQLLLAPLTPTLPTDRANVRSALSTPMLPLSLAILEKMPSSTLVLVHTTAGQLQVGAHDLIEVELIHFFPCMVPLASQLLCKDAKELLSAEHLASQLDQYSSTPELLRAQLRTRRHKILRTRATLQNHGADYFGADQ